MTATPRLLIPLGLVLAAALGLAPVAGAQDPTPPPNKEKDAGLDDLLKKLDEPKPDAPKDPKPADGSGKDDSKDKPKEPAKPDAPKDGVGKVAPKDQGLDELLGKLGASSDKPSADDKPQPGGGGGGDPMPPDDGQGKKPEGGESKKPDGLNGDGEKLDEHLRELSGKRSPRKNPQKKPGGQGQGGGGGEGQGPLDQVIEEMRDVEQRLGQPDTGEGTRQKQADIVKNLDTLIEQMNQARSQSQAMRQIRQGQKPGQKQPGDQPGAQANGPPPSRPAAPKGQPALALDKDAWGHLPQQLRDDFDNIFKEGPLPARLDLIRQYYLSLSKKNASRGE